MDPWGSSLAKICMTRLGLSTLAIGHVIHYTEDVMTCQWLTSKIFKQKIKSVCERHCRWVLK